MKEGITNNFYAPIINKGGTINGDIVNPVFNFGSQEMNEADKRKLAIECMDAHIEQELTNPNQNWRKIFTPLVAGIRAGLLPNNMTCEEFNQKYGTEVSSSTFSIYLPKDLNNSKITEVETEGLEKEFSSLLKL